MDKLKNLILSRALLAGLVSAGIVLLRKSGVMLPDGIEQAIGNFLDVGLVFVGAVVLGQMQPTKTAASAPQQVRISEIPAGREP